MSAGFEGLRTDQGPPLAVPVGFYALAPVAMAATGLLMIGVGGAGLGSRWAPAAIAATHLGTLGYLAAILLGSLFQIAPVVAGAPVPGARFAPALVAVWAVGVGALVTGFLTGRAAWLGGGATALGMGLAIVLIAAGLALARTPTRSPTVTGLRIALGGLFGVAALGELLASARAGAIVLPTSLLVTADAHAALGALVWVGGLVAAVSWQVVPMFYLAAPLPPWAQRATLVGVGASAVALPIVGLVATDLRWVAAAAAPAAIAVLVLHPALTARALLGRRRRRPEGSVSFWLAGLACAPIVLGLAIGAWLGSDPRWALALGWVAIWGWGGLITHGMLCRIVPFLVWFHRFSPHVGLVPVPSVKGLLPDARVQAAFVAHVGAVALGLGAIATGWDLLVRLAGVVMVVAAGGLAVNLGKVLSARAPVTLREG